MKADVPCAWLSAPYMYKSTLLVGTVTVVVLNRPGYVRKVPVTATWHCDEQAIVVMGTPIPMGDY